MLKIRIITALVLVVAVGGLLVFANAFWWQALMLLTVFIMGYEWAGFAKKNALIDKLIWGATFSLFVYLIDAFIVTSSFVTYFLYPPVVIMILAVFLFQRSQGKPLITNSLALFILGVLVVYPFYYAMLVIKADFSIVTILLSFFAIWAVDTGAYFSGRKYGKTKLALYVSPGKSWEGVYAGVILSFITSYLGLNFVQPEVSISYLALAFILSFIGALSIFGDLFESLLKRQVSMKDSSQILPGHGGVLDRLDSLILAMPLYLLVWQWVTIK